MEWLAMFLVVLVAVVAVAWLAGRAIGRRPPRDGDGDGGDPDEQAGPRYYDVAAGTDGGDPGDGGT
jgi:hypothetical protein